MPSTRIVHQKADPLSPDTAARIEAREAAISDLKEYGLAMGVHCGVAHAGNVAVHTACPRCRELLASTDAIWTRIRGVA